ncbi:MAG: glycosyltransferase family 4 protein [Candidatus Omnitrophica bacterium]|nr:glycosyltransferase family 4 protein [Candidatus Omnitrophota bacterium]
MEIGLKFRPDIIYAHSLTSVFPAYILSRILKSRLIIRVYGTRQLYWLWDNFWYRVKECRDYLAFRVPADYFIITNDGNMGNLLAKKMGVPDEKIKYWRNGIDDTFLSADPDAKESICRELGIASSSKIIASTCRLIPDYGVGDLLKSLVAVLNKNKDVVCIISGSGPEEDKLKEYVRENRMEKQVFFLGIVGRDKVRQILNAADIFVLLARFHNCTNTVWEAMAAGKCIVTTETEAIKEVLANRENAVLIKRDKLDEAAQVIDELLNNARLRERLAANVQSRAREILESWPKRMAKEIALLEELINRVR